VATITARGIRNKALPRGLHGGSHAGKEDRLRAFWLLAEEWRIIFEVENY
jgi:hypothetical protein